MMPININTLSELIYLEQMGLIQCAFFKINVSCLHIEWYSIDMNIRTVEILDELDNINGFHHYFGPNLAPQNKKWTVLDLNPKRGAKRPKHKRNPKQQFGKAIGIWKSQKP